MVISEELGGTGEIGVRKEVVKKPKAVGEMVGSGVRKVEMSDETETEDDMESAASLEYVLALSAPFYPSPQTSHTTPAHTPDIALWV